MKVTVNEQIQYYYLSFEREGEPNWQRKGGHAIHVGPFQFCAIPLNDRINISEVTTGCKVYEIDLNPITMAMTETKEDALEFFKNIIGESLKRKIEAMKSFDEYLTQMQKKTFERHGEMPPIENIDIDI